MKKILFISTFLLFNFTFYYGLSAFEISSSAFEDNKQIPKIYACSRQGGKDVSVPIDFKNLPEGTVSISLIMDDPDAKSVAGKTWVHWVLTDIPIDNLSLKSVKKGKLKIGKLGRNSSGSRDYQGMCPPNGKHTYIIAAYAMNKNIEKKLGAVTRKSFEKKYKNIIISKAELSGYWP